MNRVTLTLLAVIVCCKDAVTGLLSINPNSTFIHTANELAHVTCTLTHNPVCQMVLRYHTNNDTVLVCGSQEVMCGTGSNSNKTYCIIKRTEPGVIQYVLEFTANKSLNGTKYHCTAVCATQNCQCSRATTQQATIIVQDPDPCTQATLCQNNGTCVMSGPDQFKCQCAEGYEGDTCEKQTSCDPNPCLNGGTCLDVLADYQCSCASGFTGRKCSEGSATAIGPTIGVMSLLVISVLLSQIMM